VAGYSGGMLAPSWLVTLACSRCGAPGRFLADRLIAICEYCGHIISTHRAVVASHENLAFAEARSYVVPTLTDVRRLELSDQKSAAIEARDAATLHAANLELFALDAIEAGMPATDVATLARWSAAIEQVATFSGRIAMFAPSVDQLVADPAGFTVSALAQLTRVYRELVADPLFPVVLAPVIPIEVAAVDALLGCLKGWVMFASLEAISTALITLGQRPIRVGGAPLPCRTCGAPLCAESLATLACTSCRSALEVRRHLWLDGLLRVVAMANADTLVQRDRAYAVVCMLTNVTAVAGNAPLPEHLIAAYLGAIEGVERAALAEISAFVLQHHGLGADAQASVRTVQRHLDHVPAAIPPPEGRRVGAFIALAPSEAWQRAAIRNWKRVLRYATLPRDQRGLVAVNQLLPPLAGGYLPDAGDAAAFLRATGESPSELRAALALHANSEHDPDKRAFWNATTALVG